MKTYSAQNAVFQNFLRASGDGRSQANGEPRASARAASHVIIIVGLRISWFGRLTGVSHRYTFQTAFGSPPSTSWTRCQGFCCVPSP